VARSVSAPSVADMETYVKLTEQQLHSGGGGGGGGEFNRGEKEKNPDSVQDQELADRLAASGCDSVHDYLSNCNAHLGVQDAQPSRYTAYFDL